MKEKYFSDAFYQLLVSQADIETIEPEHQLITDRNQDKRTARRIDFLAYINEKPFAFEIKSDEGDNWDGIKQAVYNKKHGIENSYLVTGKRPTWEQVFAMLNEGVGCWFMPEPKAYAVPIVKIGDRPQDVLARHYELWKQEQANRKRYGG